MSWGTPDQIDRTAKILIDSGKAATRRGRRVPQALVLQVAVGPEVEVTTRPPRRRSRPWSTSGGAPSAAAYTSTSTPIPSSTPAGPLA